MSARTELVEQYFEGFRRGDHAMVLECLAEDVRWDIPGYRSLQGKAAFDAENENPEFTGHPTLDVERLVEDYWNGVVLALGKGETTLMSGEVRRFVFADFFTFEGPLIAHVDSRIGVAR